MVKNKISSAYLKLGRQTNLPFLNVEDVKHHILRIELSDKNKNEIKLVFIDKSSSNSRFLLLNLTEDDSSEFIESLNYIGNVFINNEINYLFLLKVDDEDYIDLTKSKFYKIKNEERLMANGNKQ